ncbi:hypothetical protein ACJO2E_08750 [Marinobacter sp. M1N3S26]|uniref:hypothetical protein n=1 Tax=Marinobacter sp. M1N3S26 TaxID=3382299 RepID=UPI00387AC121
MSDNSNVFDLIDRLQAMATKSDPFSQSGAQYLADQIKAHWHRRQQIEAQPVGQVVLCQQQGSQLMLHVSGHWKGAPLPNGTELFLAPAETSESTTDQRGEIS